MLSFDDAVESHRTFVAPLRLLRKGGYRLGRRGKEPESRRRTLERGVSYDPRRHDALLIPSTGVSIPDWDLAHLRPVLALGEPGKTVVLQFHGVPDVAHPWVHTPPEMFRQYMELLKSEGYETLAVRDLERFMDPAALAGDPLAETRVPEPESGRTLAMSGRVLARKANAPPGTRIVVYKEEVNRAL